jgi:hypothetical protein
MSHVISFSSIVRAAQQQSLISDASYQVNCRQLVDDLQIIVGARSAGFSVLCYLAHEFAAEIRATLAVVQSQ